MDLVKLEEALKACVVAKQEGLMFSLSFDAKKAIKDVIEVALQEAVLATDTKIDDQVVAFLLPFIDKYLDSVV